MIETCSTASVFQDVIGWYLCMAMLLCSLNIVNSHTHRPCVDETSNWLSETTQKRSCSCSCYMQDLHGQTSCMCLHTGTIWAGVLPSASELGVCRQQRWLAGVVVSSSTGQTCKSDWQLCHEFCLRCNATCLANLTASFPLLHFSPISPPLYFLYLIHLHRRLFFGACLLPFFWACVKITVMTLWKEDNGWNWSLLAYQGPC